jgi:hypothetical protein
MLRRVALVRTDVSEESITFIIRGQEQAIGTNLAVTRNRRILRRNFTSQKTAFFIVTAVKTSNRTQAGDV